MITFQHIANYIAQAGHTASGYEQQLLEKFKSFIEKFEAPEAAPVAEVVEAVPEVPAETPAAVEAPAPLEPAPVEAPAVEIPVEATQDKPQV